jgi:bis(5'-nucleosyl)-tetraphosphatase (symmetrical)
MATWVVGDVHGCLEPLERLLEAMEWRAGEDRLVLVGDLVNRGPRSLETLRWLAEQGDGAEAVLGNHDLHLLARAAGVSGPRDGDTLDSVLDAPDREELLDWLRRRPMLWNEGRHVVVHAGLSPHWSLDRARELARGLEEQLRADDWLDRVRALWSLRKTRWCDDLEGDQALASALSLFTRLRMVRPDGRAKFTFWDAPEAAPEALSPWFEQSPVPREHHVIFGHWAMLGIRELAGATCLDGGCVYGGRLAAMRLEDHRIVTVAGERVAPAG